MGFLWNILASSIVWNSFSSEHVLRGSRYSTHLPEKQRSLQLNGPMDNSTLRFFLIGDWGKGGNTGKYFSSFIGGADDDLTNLPAESKESSSETVFDTHHDAAYAERLHVEADNNKNNNKVLYQPHVARAMAKVAANSTPSPSFIVALGDNFYVNGVSSATDVLWTYLWSDVYLQYPSLNVPWYAVLGNHDYGGGNAYSLAQVERSRLNIDHGLWNMPAKNYSKIFPIPGKDKASVGILFIDTTTLAPSMNKCCNEQGGVSQATQAELIQNQLYHLERMLQTMVAEEPTWLLAAGHYPIFSDSNSGNVTELITYLLPLLQKYHVHAYLCGHDHLSEHLTYHNMHFFVAGAGSMTDKISKTSAAKLQWAGPGYAAFAYMDATPETLTIRYVDIDNVEQYAYTLTDPHQRAAVDNDPPTHGSDDSDDASNAAGVDKPGPVDGSDLDKLHQRIEEEENKATVAVAIAAVSSSLLALSGIMVLVYFYGGNTKEFWTKKKTSAVGDKKRDADVRYDTDDGGNPKRSRPLEPLDTALPTCSTCDAANPTWTSSYDDEIEDMDDIEDMDHVSDETVWSHSHDTGSCDGDQATAYTTTTEPPPPTLPPVPFLQRSHHQRRLSFQPTSLPRPPSHRYASSYDNSPQSGSSSVSASATQSWSSSSGNSHSDSYSSYSSEASLPPAKTSIKGSSFLQFLSLPTFLQSAASSFSSSHVSPPTMTAESSKDTQPSMYSQASSASSASSAAIPVRYPHHRRSYQQLSSSEYIRLDELQHPTAVSGARVVTAQPPRFPPVPNYTVVQQKSHGITQHPPVRTPLASATGTAAVPVHHVHFASHLSSQQRQSSVAAVPLVPVVEIRGDDATASTLTAASIDPISSVSDGSDTYSAEPQDSVAPLFVPVHSPEHLAHLRHNHRQHTEEVKSAHRRVKSSSL